MRVKDVMMREFETVHPEATLQEAARRLHARKGHQDGTVPSLLVMEGDRPMGIVTPTDLLRAVLPSYLAQDPHLAHLGWDGLLERQCKKVREKAVREVMTREVVTVDEEAVLAEAAEMLFTHHIHVLPVMSGRRVVGILGLTDLAWLVFDRMLDQKQ